MHIISNCFTITRTCTTPHHNHHHHQWSVNTSIALMIYWCDHPPSPQVLINTFYTQQVISQLRILSRSVATGSKFDRELWSNGLSPVLNLWKKLNQVGTHTASILPSVLFPFSESSYSLLPAPYSLFTLLLFCNHHREDWDSRPTLAEYYLGERTYHVT